MKLIALDVGEKRIGVATADSSVRIAVPHSTILVDGNELEQIARIMQAEGAKHLIVGLPRNNNGEETPQSKVVRAFVDSLQLYFIKHKLKKPLVKFQDESLTSVIAEQNLNQNKRKKRHKGDVDQEAATLILQDFLDNFTEDATKLETAKEARGVKKNSKLKHRILIFFMLLVALAVVAVVGGISWYAHATKPVCEVFNDTVATTMPCPDIEFKITEGESVKQIAESLESEGLVRSATAFKVYLKLNYKEPSLKAGEYTLSGRMSVEEIILQLRGGSQPATFRITFLPGGTLADAKARLVAAGYAKTAVDAAFAADYSHPVLAGKPNDATLEGYIYGETYEFYVGAALDEILMRVFEELHTVVTENDLIAQYSEQGLSLYEGITLASIAQKEAYAADQPTVVQVFLLRRKLGMPLGSDAVIGYAADQINPGRDKTDLSYLYSIGCPWNSRRCVGLPPSPISNPGKAALLAVASPSDTDYIYFLTGDDNKMYYAHTAEQHEQNITDHCKTMCTFL